MSPHTDRPLPVEPFGLLAQYHTDEMLRQAEHARVRNAAREEAGARAAAGAGQRTGRIWIGLLRVVLGFAGVRGAHSSRTGRKRG